VRELKGKEQLVKSRARELVQENLRNLYWLGWTGLGCTGHINVKESDGNSADIALYLGISIVTRSIFTLNEFKRISFCCCTVR
jgi:hypothetical protein